MASRRSRRYRMSTMRGRAVGLRRQSLAGAKHKLVKGGRVKNAISRRRVPAWASRKPRGGYARPRGY